jgi:hypothetical protein
MCQGLEEIPKTLKTQRYLNTPGLGQRLSMRALQEMKKGKEKIEEAAKRYGWAQREVAEDIGIHFRGKRRRC